MISTLTKEQEAKIPEYIQKWVDLTSQPIDREKVFKLASDIFVKEKPLIIFAESLENLKNLILFILQKNKIKPSQLYSQLYIQSPSQLYSQLPSQLPSQLHSQLSRQLSSQLHSQLDSQLYNQLPSQLHIQLDSQLHSQLYSQLYNQLYSQLSSQLHSQLDSQLYSQLSSQLDSQLYSQLDSQLSSQLYSQLSSQLHSQLDSQLDSQLSSQLHSQLPSQKINFSRYISFYLYDWAGYYDYADYIGVDFDKSKKEKYFDILLNIPICYFVGNIVFIMEKPVCSWRNKMLHSDKIPAISWKDGTGIYFFHGINFDKDLWQKIVDKTLPAEEVFKIENTEQRAVAVKELGAEKIIKELKGKVIDQQQFPYGVDYLIELEGFLDGLKQPYKFLKGFDPAENDYVYVRVHPKCKTVEEAQSFSYRLEMFNINYNPQSRT